MLFRDLDVDPDDIGAVDHVDCCGAAPLGERKGALGSAVGSPVVGKTKSNVLVSQATITPVERARVR